MPAIEQDERRALLDEIERQFGIKLLWLQKAPQLTYRDDVTTHAFFDPERRLTDDLKLDIRRWLEPRGWQFYRQLRMRGNNADPTEHIYLAPMIPVEIEVGYHATRRASLPSIKEHGLLPSVPARQTTENRWDCEGNIFLCENLGTPADAGVPGSESAHWWRDHFAHNNRFGDLEWVILRVEVGRLAGARMYRDIWSKSGIIVGGVPTVASELIELKYHTP